MFEHIKDGVFVLVPVALKERGLYDRNPTWYWVRCKVSKVTPKRFTANKQTYKKVDGSDIRKPEQWRPAYKGCKPYSEETDQLAEYKSDLQRLKFYNEMSEMFSGIKVKDYSQDQLNRILNILKER